MATSTQTPVEEYLRTSYDPDREYVDGEVLDRNVGEQDHSFIQKRLLRFLMQQEEQLGICAVQEWRMRLDARHYRIPDVMIIVGPVDRERVRSKPPFVCIEILSPEDRQSRMQKKVAEYLAFGVGYVWVLDPESKEAFAYTTNGFEKVSTVLRTENPVIEIPLTEIFD